MHASLHAAAHPKAVLFRHAARPFVKSSGCKFPRPCTVRNAAIVAAVQPLPLRMFTTVMRLMFVPALDASSANRRGDHLRRVRTSRTICDASVMAMNIACKKCVDKGKVDCHICGQPDRSPAP